jgi:hypothetical protein
MITHRGSGATFLIMIFYHLLRWLDMNLGLTMQNDFEHCLHRGEICYRPRVQRAIGKLDVDQWNSTYFADFPRELDANYIFVSLKAPPRQTDRCRRLVATGATIITILTTHKV